MFVAPVFRGQAWRPALVVGLAAGAVAGAAAAALILLVRRPEQYRTRLTRRCNACKPLPIKEIAAEVAAKISDGQGVLPPRACMHAWGGCAGSHAAIHRRLFCRYRQHVTRRALPTNLSSIRGCDGCSDTQSLAALLSSARQGLGAGHMRAVCEPGVWYEGSLRERARHSHGRWDPGVPSHTRPRDRGAGRRCHRHPTGLPTVSAGNSLLRRYVCTCRGQRGQRRD